MKSLNRAEAAGFLLVNDNFCILTHRRPDGDTVGSAAALCLGLRKLGKQAWVLKNEEISDRFGWLVEGLTKEAVEEHDIVVSVDVASPGMLPKSFAPLAETCRLRIDHHGSATSFTPEELVDADSASCAELVCDVLAILGVEMDKNIAEAVYVGMSTDTGCFRFANTTAHSFTVAAVCAKAGADIYGLNQQLFETNSLPKLRMHAWMIENMKLLDDGKLAIVAIPRAVEELLRVTDDDMDNISSYPRTVAGVRMAATLRQTKDGETKISVRAIPGYDAAAVCAHFGGGGHKGAAGATVNMPLHDAASAVAQIMTAQ
jgi:phosphoesterase RecJ-like protein